MCSTSPAAARVLACFFSSPHTCTPVSRCERRDSSGQGTWPPLASGSWPPSVPASAARLLASAFALAKGLKALARSHPHAVIAEDPPRFLGRLGRVEVQIDGRALSPTLEDRGRHTWKKSEQNN